MFPLSKFNTAAEPYTLHSSHPGALGRAGGEGGDWGQKRWRDKRGSEDKKTRQQGKNKQWKREQKVTQLTSYLQRKKGFCDFWFIFLFFHGKVSLVDLFKSTATSSTSSRPKNKKIKK